MRVSLYGFICDKVCPVMTAQREKDIHINSDIFYRKIDSLRIVVVLYPNRRANIDDTDDDYESSELRNYSVMCISKYRPHIKESSFRRSPKIFTTLFLLRKSRHIRFVMVQASNLVTLMVQLYDFDSATMKLFIMRWNTKATRFEFLISSLA